MESQVLVIIYNIQGDTRMQKHNKNTKGKDTLDDVTWFDIIKGIFALIIIYYILYQLYVSMLLLE